MKKSGASRGQSPSSAIRFEMSFDADWRGKTLAHHGLRFRYDARAFLVSGFSCGHGILFSELGSVFGRVVS